MKMTNHGNRLIYRLWSPVYDSLFDRFAIRGRRRAFEVLDPQPGENLLLVGIGTGADLPFLPAGVRAVGVDFSPDMLARARARLPLAGREVALARGDAQLMPLRTGAFDAAVLSLVLSVVPDGAACLRETARAVRPGGRIIIFDKFLPDGARPNAARRTLNLLTTLIGTDINRSLGDLLAGTGCTILHDEASLLGGAYRTVLLETPVLGAEPVRRASLNVVQPGGVV